jgi:hypothetical protein
LLLNIFLGATTDMETGIVRRAWRACCMSHPIPFHICSLVSAAS